MQKDAKTVLVVDDTISSYNENSAFSSMYEYARKQGYGQYLPPDEKKEKLRSFHEALAEESDNGLISFKDLEGCVSRAAQSIGLSYHPDNRETSILQGYAAENQAFIEQGIDLQYVVAEPFNERNVLEKVLSRDYDVLLLDMGFNCTPEGLAQLAQESRIANLYQQQGCYRHGFNPGGIYVAKRLEESGRGYSFWTQDFGHAEENMRVAEELGLLSRTNIKEAERDERRSIEQLKEIPFQYDHHRQDETVGSDSTGKLIVSRKNIYSRTAKFLRIVDIASQFNELRLRSWVEPARRYR